MSRPESLLIGVISDTHGLVRPEALSALADCDHILHAGDVGDEQVLDALRGCAPVTAVRGNTDTGTCGLRLPESALVHFADVTVFLIHDVLRLRLVPETEGIDVLVCGHSHAALNETVSGVLRFNPGSAGPRRFDRPVTVGRLRIRGRRVAGEIVKLRAR